MFNLTSSQRSACLAVSLWQGTELLGWFRGRDIGDTGMLVTGPVERLADNSIVTVAIELQHQDVITTVTVKALVVHSTYNGAEIWWANQLMGLRPLMAESARQIA